MKRLLEAVVVATLLLTATAAHATPSTVVWTPATTYTQPFLIPHITYDTYLGERTILQETWGLTVGVIPDNKYFEGEVGLDLMYPLFPTVNPGPDEKVFKSKTAFVANAKLSLKEGSLHEYAPGLSVGGYGLGFTKDTTDYDIVYGVIGKTFGPYGTVAFGGYHGNSRVLLKVDHTTGELKKDNNGFLASYSSPKLNIDTVGLKGLSAAIDYQSGKSSFGALGAAVTFYFTDAISILTGPVWFNDKYALSSVNFAATRPAAVDQPKLVWTVQLDVDIDFSKPKPAAPPKA
jgi:hypothetical protein